MTVIRTEAWLADLYDKPLQLCEKLEPFFPDGKAREINEYLLVHGMYRPTKQGKEQVEALRKKKIWDKIKQEEQNLRRLWNGPNIPIFIFPADGNNPRLKKDTNGKSGLAFKDKLFLFISENNHLNEVKALFTHEFNHVCRLSNSEETDYTLLDSIILEGLAEDAVRERFGEESLAAWTSYYTNEQLEHFWRKLILPNKTISKMEEKHDRLLYGFGLYPKMVGYCVGYYLVCQYRKKHKLVSKELMNIPSAEIASIKT